MSCELNQFRATLVLQLKLPRDVWGSSGASPGAAAVLGALPPSMFEWSPQYQPFPSRVSSLPAKYHANSFG